MEIFSVDVSVHYQQTMMIISDIINHNRVPFPLEKQTEGNQADGE